MLNKAPRRRKTKSGKIWVGYYYNGRKPDGSRIEIPLGTDLVVAKRKWAELECVETPIDSSLMKHVFDRYERDILPKKASSTQRENKQCLSHLRPLFDNAPIDAIQSHDIAQYRDARSAPIRANREIAVLSHVFTMAIEWGFTTRSNPCFGLKRNKQHHRTFYADPDVWNAVYEAASLDLRDAMDLAYLTGQRPADVLKMSSHDVHDDKLYVRQGKTGQMLRFRLKVDDQATELGKCVNRLLESNVSSMSGHLICTEKNQPLTMKMLRDRFDAARLTASEKSKKSGKTELASRIKAFQFRDIRPKAASEIVELEDASKLLGHTNLQITKKVYRRLGETVMPTK